MSEMGDLELGPVIRHAAEATLTYKGTEVMAILEDDPLNEGRLRAVLKCLTPEAMPGGMNEEMYSVTLKALTGRESCTCRVKTIQPEFHKVGCPVRKMMKGGTA